MKLFEAARWAPSSGNGQPWRFVYGVQGTAAFEKLFALLVPANQAWCKKAGALVAVAAKSTRHNGAPSRLHLLDTGAAWMSFALQGSKLGLVVHGMEGFDHNAARTVLAMPDELEPAHMIAVGHPAPASGLPEKYRAGEVPSGRRSAAESVFEGSFRGQLTEQAD
jgi:nitroreductase